VIRDTGSPVRLLGVRYLVRPRPRPARLSSQLRLLLSASPAATNTAVTGSCLSRYTWSCSRHFLDELLLHCSTVLINAPTSVTVTDKLQRVLNAASRAVSGTNEFDRGLSHLLHDELQWLNVLE